MPKKPINHPFGRENEVALGQLLTFFCNNVYLGQWELARACMRELCEQKELLKLDVTEILSDISVNPYKSSLGSEGIQTPHHLSWLCLQEYKKWIPQHAQDIVQSLERDVSFRLLLAEVYMTKDLETADTDVLQELYQFYRELAEQHSHETKESNSAKEGKAFSTKCQEFLSLILSTRPALGAAVLQALCSTSTSQTGASQLAETLTLLHLKCLQNIYRQIKEKVYDSITSDSPLEMTEILQTLSEKFYNILALFDPTREMINIQTPLREFFLDLLKTTHRLRVHLEASCASCALLEESAIYSALLGRRTTYLVQVYADTEQLLRTEEDLSAEKALGPSADLSQVEMSMVALARISDRRESWRRMSMICVKHQKHFLDLIMEAAVHLIQGGDFSRLGALLEPAEFRPLRPLVLLVGWEHCSDIFPAKQLIQTLFANEEDEQSSHPALSRACRSLTHQLELTEWCLAKARKVFQQSDCDLDQQESALFQGLEGHSVLYMLHQLTPLSSLVPGEVLGFLQTRPSFPSPGDQKKSKKSVRFADVSAANSDPKLSADPAQPITSEQEIDASIYRSFCAMKHFMEAISFCVNNGDWEKQLPGIATNDTPVPTPTEATPGQAAAATDKARSEFSNSSNSTLQFESLQQMYDEHVVDNLKRGQEYVRSVFPFTQRLEILENTFSLLFVTHEDISNRFVDEQLDSDEGAEGLPSVGSPGSAGKTPTTPTSLGSLSELNNSDRVAPQRGSSISSALDSWVMLSISDTIAQNDASHSQKDQTEAKEALVFENGTVTEEGVKVEGTLFGKYSVTKAELKPPSSGTEGKRNRLMSENLSTNSNTSIGSSNKIGFICNEYVTRDILLTLKECLLDLSSLQYSSHKEQGLVSASEQQQLPTIAPHLEEQMLSRMQYSIEKEQLQNRSKRLMQYVSEALWRLQLVAHDWVPQTKGKLVTDTSKLDFAMDSDEDLDASFEEEEDAYQRKPRKRRHFNSTSSTGGDISDQTAEPSRERQGAASATAAAAGTTDGSISACSNNSRYARKRHRRSRRSKVKRLLRAQQGVIPRMLATKDTLLCMCLRRHKYAQAEQVVKMFNLEGSPRAAELSFAEQFQSAVRKLQSQSSRSLQHQLSSDSTASPSSSSSSRPKVGLGQTSLSAIANVAAVGVASMSAVSAVDQILSLTALPSFPPEMVSELHQGGATYGCHIQQDHIPAMIVLDLACAGCKTLGNSLNLLEAARGRLPHGVVSDSDVLETVSPEAEDRLTTRTHPVGNLGIVKFLKAVSELVALGTTEGLSEYSRQFYDRGLNKALTCATFPLSARKLQTLARISAETEKSVKRVEKAVEDTEMSLESSLSLVKKRGKGREEKPQIRIAMKHLMSVQEKQLPDEGLARFILGRSSQRSCNYFSSLYDHVKTLARLVVECEEQTQEPGPIEYFTVLRESPTSIIGKVIFVNKIHPEKLEDLAKKLHLNLTQIIVNCCSPKIPCRRPMLPPLEQRTVGSKIVLNCGESLPQKKTHHPEVLVREILTKLTQLMKDKAEIETMNAVFTEDLAVDLVTSTDFQQIMCQAQLLTAVDLTLLTTLDEKLSFYGNLVNLMSLHAMFYCLDKQIKLENAKMDIRRGRSQSSVSVSSISSSGSSSQLTKPWSKSSLDTVLLQSKLVYNIGQLGFVSLHDLKHLVIRQGLSPPECLDGLVAARGTNLDKLDPWQKHGPPTDPRLLFVISDGTPSSPPLQVLSSQLVRSQLRSAMEDYLNRTVKVDMDSKQFTLPEMLLEYQADFVSRPTAHRKEARDTTERYGSLERHESLLMFVHAHVTGELATQLEDVINAMQSASGKSKGKKEVEKQPSAQIIVQAASNGPLCYTFDYDTWQQQYQEHQSTATRRSSMPSVLPPSTQGEPSAEITRTLLRQDSRGTHRLTSVTLDYLKQKSDFLSTLCALINVDESDDLQCDLQENYFPAKTPEMEKQLGDLFKSKGQGLRQFKYQCLQQKYPTLQRYTLRQLLALLVNFDPAVLNSANIPWELTRRNIPDDVRTCTLSAPSSALYQRLLWNAVKELALRSNWTDAIELLTNCPSSATELDPDWIVLKDYILCCAGLADTRKDSSSTLDDSVDVRPVENWSFLLLIKDRDLRIRTILGNLRRWTVRTCTELMKACRSWDCENVDLRDALKQRLHEMEIFQKIIDFAHETKRKIQVITPDLETRSLEDVDQMQSTNQLADTLLTWQGIVDQSEADPMSVVEFLLPSKKFDVIYAWADIFSISQELEQEIHNCYIFYLLEKQNCDVVKATQVLEKLRRESPERCFEVTDNLLHQLPCKQNTLFVAEYMLQYMREQLSEAQMSELRLLCIGCRGLLCLPDNSRADYDHLVFRPLLLLEQLLMNIKIDWASQVLASIKKDLEAAVSTTNGQCPLPLDVQKCETLLVTYATAALEFSVVQGDYSGSGTMSRSMSRMSLSLTATDQLPGLPQQQYQKSHRRVSSGSTYRSLMRTGTTPTGFRPSSSMAVIPKQVAGSAGTTPKYNMSLPGNMNKGLSLTPRSLDIAPPKIGFIMPPTPPTKDQWVPDAAASVCMVCEQERFSMFNRRHHCRRCGRVVCSSCSTKTTMVCGRSARTCDDCYEQIFKRKEGTEESKLHKLHKENLARLSEASPGSGIHFMIGSPHSQGSGGTPTTTDSLLRGGEFLYMLSADEELNELTRDEFYYDHAPSTSLCLSILALHSDACCYGETVLDLCDSVSKLLQPIAPGVKNPEVDYSLIISMLKTLLFNAKVKFVSVANNDGVGRCEIYLDRVNLLDLLVTHNCAYLPSVQQLTKIDILRRLRDKLIEEERWSLAMEVSTKCGIDATGVWITWGKSCIRVGDYAKAREKFNKCFKPGAERGQSQMPNKLLTEILDCLESAPCPEAKRAEALLAPLRSVKDLLAEPAKRPVTERHIEEPQLQECVHYLQCYGTPLSMLTFYRKHGYWGKAVQYVLNKKCSAEIMQEGLLAPSLASGDIGHLQHQMSQADPSLESWHPYLTAICRYLNKMKHMNVLYQFQLFMKDYIRASMICITHFYQHGADSYISLHSRVQHLQRAKQHLEAYLEERQWTSSSSSRTRHPSWGREQAEVAVKLLMTPAEVAKYVHTIDLQIEVTKCLYQYHDNLLAIQQAQRQASSEMSASASSALTGQGGNPFDARAQVTPPTLFGSTKVKAEVASLVMLSGNNVHDGFGLAFRIIQDFRLDTTYIYNQVGRHFARDNHFQSIHQLLGCIKDSGLSSDQAFDEVIGTCVRVLTRQPSESKEVEALIKLIRIEANKINAYILCGKLKSAYLIAVKRGDADDIRRIAGTAERTGQTAVKNICDKWLQQQKKSAKPEKP